jgi:broad specificity phosphatase PhoE
MPQLILVRHGQASFGATDYDVLSELGARQAQLTADALQRATPRIGRVLSGALNRQRDTAHPIAEAYGLTAELDPRLDEYDADAILAHHGGNSVRLEERGQDAPPLDRAAFQAVLELALSEWIEAGTGSPADESYPAFVERVTAALTDAATAGRGTTVLVCSGGVLAAIAAGLLSAGGPQSFIALNRVVVNCGICRVIVGSSGTNLVSFNEQQHLGRAELTYR